MLKFVVVCSMCCSVLKQGLGSDVNESDLVPLGKKERRQVLQLARIAMRHGIWRELMLSIRKSSTELNDTMEPVKKTTSQNLWPRIYSN